MSKLFLICRSQPAGSSHHVQIKGITDPDSTIPAFSRAIPESDGETGDRSYTTCTTAVTAHPASQTAQPVPATRTSQTTYIARDEPAACSIPASQPLRTAQFCTTTPALPTALLS